MMLLFVRPAIAEAAQRILDAIDLTDAQSLAEENNLDMERVIGAFLSGDFESAFSTVEWRSVADRLFADGAGKLIRALIPPIGLSLLMRLMLKKGAAMQRAARFVCRAACVILLAGNFSNVAASARQVFAISEKCISAITPAMVTAAAFTGADGTSAVISPAAALAGGAIRDCLSSGGMTLAISAATIAAAGNMAEGISLERLFRLIRQTAQTLSGVLVAAFMGMTALGVRMGAARDGAMVRTAHFAIESVVPVVGGSVSESLDVLLATAATVKNAIGATGLFLIAAACFSPIARIGINTLILKCISAVSEPVQDDMLTAMTDQFAGAGEILLVISISAALLAATLMGGCIAIGGGRV